MTTTTRMSKTYEEYKAEHDARVKRDTEYLAALGIEWPRCGFWVDEGWRKIVDDALKELIAAGWNKKLDQVKQKFCGLRIYINDFNPVLRPIIDRAEELSFKTCEGCGAEREKKGVKMGRAYCNACDEKLRLG